MQKVQALPRKSIKKGQYNFADLLGDINYIGDDKAPMFKSRGLGAKKTEEMPAAALLVSAQTTLEPVDIQPLMTPNTQSNDRKKLLMSKFIGESDQTSAEAASNTEASEKQKAGGAFSIKNLQKALIITPKSTTTSVDHTMMNSRQLPQSNAQDNNQRINDNTDLAASSSN